MADLRPEDWEYATDLLEWSHSLDERREWDQEPAAGDLVLPEDRLEERL